MGLARLHHGAVFTVRDRIAPESANAEFDETAPAKTTGRECDSLWTSTRPWWFPRIRLQVLGSDSVAKGHGPRKPRGDLRQP